MGYPFPMASGRQSPGRFRWRESLRAGEAYRTLDLDPGASETAIREAYRRKVKEVHPDADGGDPDEFKRVTAAYERLQER